MVVEHVLGHERLPEQRARHDPKFLLGHPAVAIGIREACVPGQRVDRVDAGGHPGRVSQDRGVAGAHVAGGRAGVDGDGSREDVRHHHRPGAAGRQRERSRRLEEAYVVGLRIIHEADMGGERIAGVALAVAQPRHECGREIPVELRACNRVGEAGTRRAVEVHAEIGDPRRLPSRVGWAGEVLDPDKATAAEERLSEDARIGGPLRRCAERVVEGVPEGEGKVDRRVVPAGVGQVHVRRERHVHVLDGVAARWQRIAIRGGVERLEVPRFPQESLPQRRAHAQVVGRVGRRDVVDGEHEVEDVLVAAGVVPGHRPMLDQNAQRMLSPAIHAGPAVPGEPPQVALRCGREPSKQRVVEVVCLVDLGRHAGGLGPRGRVPGLARIVDRLDLFARPRSGGIEEERRRGVPGPRIGGTTASDDAGDLQPGVVHVLVERTLGPEATPSAAAPGRIDADAPVREQTAIHPVDRQRADGASAEPEPSRLAGARPAPSNRAGRGRQEQHQNDDAHDAPHQKVSSSPSRRRRGSPRNWCVPRSTR